MTLSQIVRALGGLVLATALSGCFDVAVDVAILGADSAKVTTAFNFDKQTYDMMMAQGGQGDFCGTKSKVTVNADNVTCVDVTEGDFATVFKPTGNGEPQPVVTNVGPGLYKVTLPTGTISEQLSGQGISDDPKTAEVIKSMFAGRHIKVQISGGEIVDTNMTKSADGKSAGLDIPFEGLFDGSFKMPNESYAVVKIN